MKPDDLRTLVEDLHDARDKWHELGLQLRIDNTSLKAIESEQRGDTAKCLREMIAKWLSIGSHNCTIQSIIEALCSNTVGKQEVARKLRNRYSGADTVGSRKRQRNPEFAETKESSKRICIQARSQFARYLQNIYGTIQLETDKKYDVSAIKSYINLACMDSIDQDREFAQHAVHGSIDEYICKKKLIEVTDIAQKIGNCYCKLILIEGAPGIGKTTLSHELCRRWSSCSQLTHYRLVLLIKLRDSNVQQATSFENLLKCISEDCLGPQFDSIYKEVTRENGEGILFILEGLDELQASIRENESSIFMKLIRGRLLPACTVMVTTRPWAVASIPTDAKNRRDQHFEIVGFTKENIISFINSVVEEGMRQSVHNYVNSNPHILSAMYNPLCAQIVVCVYMEYRRDREHYFPHTITELYKRYVAIILEGHASLSKDYTSNELDIANLPPSMKTHYDHICKMAYEGIMKQDQVLVYHVEKPREFETLGLMRTDQPLYRTGKSHRPSFHFIHFTLQEFMAAMHISNCYEAEKIVSMFKSSNNVKHAMVLRFLAGLTRFQNDKLRYILPLPTIIPRDRYVPLHPRYTELASTTSTKLFCNVYFTPVQISWLYESQNKLLFSLYKDRIIAFTTKCASTPQEYFELGYCIAACGTIINLEVDCCIICERFQILIAALKSFIVSCKLQYLSIQSLYQPVILNMVSKGWSIDEFRKTLQSLISVLCSNPKLQQALPNCSSTSADMIYFPSVLGSTLKELEISCLPNSIVWDISNLKSLQGLTLVSPGLDRQSSCLCEFLEGNKALRKLKLVFKFTEKVYKIMADPWFIDFSPYSTYEFNVEQLSSTLIASFLEHGLADNAILYTLLSLKCNCIYERIPDDDPTKTARLPKPDDDDRICKELCLHPTKTARSEVFRFLRPPSKPKPCFDLKNWTFDRITQNPESSYDHLLGIIKASSMETIEIGLDHGVEERNVIGFMEGLQRNTSIEKFTAYVAGTRTSPISFTSKTDIEFSSVPAFHVESESSLAIGNMLRENTTLQCLELAYVTRDNGPRHIYTILDALRQNTTLKTLLLQKQEHSIECSQSPTLSPEEDFAGSKTIHNLLIENQTLEVLQVSLFTEHYPTLLKGLCANKVLKEVHLPQEHASHIVKINCPEYINNAHRIYFTNTFKYHHDHFRVKIHSTT